MQSRQCSGKLRTTLQVQIENGRKLEILQGRRHGWSFRAHYHLGDEKVTITEGRARLRTLVGFRDVEAGETLIVPAGTVHRFEPVDSAGWAFISKFSTNPDGSLTDSLCSVVERVKSALVLRPSLQTDIEGLASACAISAGYLSRVFRSQVGTSVHNFHVLIALHKAKKLLQEQNPVVDAAIDAGFFDQAHLTREFVRMVGLTPGSFRTAWAGLK